MTNNYDNFFKVQEKGLNFNDIKKDLNHFKKFLSKLEKNQSFLDTNGSRIKVLNGVEILKKVGYYRHNNYDIMLDNFVNRYSKKKFLQTKKGFVPLSRLEKTYEFGSSKGSSAGSKETQIFETIQLLFLYTFLIEKKLYVDLVDYHVSSEKKQDKIINKLYKYQNKVNTPIKLDEINIKKYVDDENWCNSFISVCESLQKNFLYKKSDFVLYHSNFKSGRFINSMNGIFKVIKSIIKDVYDLNVHMSKWNPCDIWIVNQVKQEQIRNYFLTSLKKLKNDVKKIKSLNLNETELKNDLTILVDKFIVDFNKKLRKLYENGDLVGVSLKKVKNLEARFVESDFDRELDNLPFYVYDDFSVLPLKSNRIFVRNASDDPQQISKFNDGYIDLRTFQKDVVNDMVGEIGGKTARYGKISLSYINYILNKYGISKIDNKETLEQLRDDLLVRRIKKILNRLDEIDTIDYEYLQGYDLIVKYQSLRLIEILEDFKETEYTDGAMLSDKILTEIFLYALSIKSDVFKESIFHVKIV